MGLFIENSGWIWRHFRRALKRISGLYLWCLEVNREDILLGIESYVDVQVDFFEVCLKGIIRFVWKSL